MGKRLIATTVTSLSLCLCGIAEVHSSFTYHYEGLNFTLVEGTSPQVSTSDHLSGFVEFATAPTPNETGKKDWIAYSLSDGARTLSSANGDNVLSNTSFFDFDALLDIVNWEFIIAPDSEQNTGNVIATATAADSSRLGGGTVQQANAFPGGTWEAAAAVVPEPATLALFGVGLAGLGFARRRTLN